MKSPQAEGVRVFEVGPGTKPQWDGFVSEQETGNLLQAWGWGELRRRYGWQILRLAAARGNDDQWGRFRFSAKPSGQVG